MLEIKVDQSSVDSTLDYLERVKQRILDGVRAGMAEGMQVLAANTVAEMAAAGIQNRTRALAENVLNSPHLSENENSISGKVYAGARVKAKGGGMYSSNLGNILNMGFADPAVGNEPMHQITAPDGYTSWARGHVAFDVKPHPFFRKALAVSESPIMDLIRARVAEATGE